MQCKLLLNVALPSCSLQQDKFLCTVKRRDVQEKKKKKKKKNKNIHLKVKYPKSTLYVSTE